MSNPQKKEQVRMEVEVGSMMHPISTNFREWCQRRGGGQQPCIDCGEYDHRTSKSKKCAKSTDFDPAAPAAKRCTACDRRGHASLNSKLCPQHTANLPRNEVLTTSGPVGEGTDGVSEEPVATDHSTEKL
jgi:hypothetical protein